MTKPVVLITADSQRNVSAAFGLILNIINAARCHKASCSNPCNVSLFQLKEAARALVKDAAPDEVLELSQRIDKADQEGIFH